MNKQPKALRLADDLQSAVQTYPQMSEDEPGGYCRQEDALMDDAAAELRRLHAQNKALNDALQSSMGCHREMSELAVRQRARLDELERLQPKRELTDDEARRIYNEATYHASIAVFMTRMDAEHQDADDKGVSGWLQEAEDRVKCRIIGREPLTNEQVKAGLIHLIEYTDARERCAFNIGVRFAERAHGIK